jgi:iron(III) transport system substrate-binding protein
MKAALPGILVLAALLIVPFALRPPEVVQDADDEVLVILTAHNEAIRYEFSRGFRLHMQHLHQRKVRLDWRSPGGASEIARFLSGEYRSAFELHWTQHLKRPFTERVATSFANPKQSTLGNDEASSARRAFLASNVGIKVDVLFGGGSFDFSQHAAAGRLVDAGVVSARPELFNEQVIPQSVGGEPYWDREGRWVGACVSGFGICYSKDTLTRLGVTQAPKRWADLADPRLIGQVALADPSKSGSATKAFEMILQQSMSQAVTRAALGHAGPLAKGGPQEAAALAEGFDDGLRLIRKIAGNSRYFTDAAGKIPQDIAAGSAAAGMCIDFYGRFQSEAAGVNRLGFVLPEGGTSLGSDPIGLLRGAPAAALGRELMNYVLSPAGQALWGYRKGVPGGPERYALRRLPILPSFYASELTHLRSDPAENPYQAANNFTYRPSWTGPLFRALAFVVRVMCVDTEEELHTAWTALVKHGFPPRALARFEDMSLVSHEVVKTQVAPALASGSPLVEIELQNLLVGQLKAQYEEVARLARSGQ